MSGRVRLVLAGLVTAAATGALAVAVDGAAEVPNPTVAGQPPTPGRTAEPTPGSYVAEPREVRGEVKEAAARFVERVGSWGASESADPPARVAAEGYPADLAAEAAPLLDVAAREAWTQVVYPQYGGLTETTASVVVLARQRLTGPEGETSREVLVDVRVRLVDGAWRVTSVIDPPRPPLPPSRPGGPTATGAAVLADPRIQIPEPGRADITARRLADPIMTVLSQLARTYDVEVNAVATGHPRTVFPTTRPSNHAVGRAVDIRAIDGVPVIEIPRDAPVLRRFMVAAGRAGATEVGGPVPVAGSGFLTDEVHQDHIHIGITPTKPPATPA